ncbi:MAG TPA: response regulator [Verrucomicrobiae bacterium]|jgi:CheY-like chemotaxis protein|nr:response regulator [Verrucomicrobiae bacterium]
MPVERTESSLEFSNGSRRVLCVDDVEVILSLLTRILENNGYEVTTSTSAVRAVEMFRCGEYELAILDYEMPVMNGAELAAQLKMASPELKIILYTGAVYVDQHELRFIDQLVHKSEGLAALLTAIEVLLPGGRYFATEANTAPAPARV